MVLIDRYLVRSYLSNYLILLAVGIGLYVVSDLLVNADEYMEDHAVPPGEVLRLMADFYVHNLPLYFSQLAGPVMAIAAAFTLGSMLRNNEMTALAASGMPLQRLAAPLLACSLLLVGLWLANRELLIPAFAAKIARSHDDVLGRSTGGVYCARDQRNAVLTALRLHPRAGRLEKVYVIEPNPDGLPGSLIEADAAEYDASRGVWRLERGRRLVVGEPMRAGELGDPIRYEPVSEYAFQLSPEELVLRQSAEWADLMSLSQMNALLRAGNLANQSTIDMARHVRLTTPLVQIVLVLLVVPFFLSREPTSVLSAGGAALVLGGLFFLSTFLAHGAVRDEGWAAVAAWMPILIFAPVGVLNLANART